MKQGQIAVNFQVSERAKKDRSSSNLTDIKHQSLSFPDQNQSDCNPSPNLKRVQKKDPPTRNTIQPRPEVKKRDIDLTTPTLMLPTLESMVANIPEEEYAKWYPRYRQTVLNSIWGFLNEIMKTYHINENIKVELGEIIWYRFLNINFVFFLIANVVIRY